MDKTIMVTDSMGKLIFFADDDKMIINLMEYTFSNRDGYTVKSFRRGEDVLDALKTEQPDLVVLDYNFFHEGKESLSGLEVLKQIRGNSNDVPVIMLSGQEDKNLIPEFMKHGATRYIAKDSFFIDSLIESIQIVMKGVN
jgi:DNA-binding NtrC family response regulator